MIFPWVSNNRGDSATIEHFREKGPFYWGEGLKEEDLAICCGSCNSSRHRKKLSDWFQTAYCADIKRKINKNTIAKPVKDYIIRRNVEF